MSSAPGRQPMAALLPLRDRSIAAKLIVTASNDAGTARVAGTAGVVLVRGLPKGKEICLLHLDLQPMAALRQLRARYTAAEQIAGNPRTTRPCLDLHPRGKV